MIISYSLPALTLRNGVITGYSLSCVPEVGARGKNTILMQYTAAGTFTLGGFTPATSYNCSISAANSKGSGPRMYRVVTTLDDGKCGYNGYINRLFCYLHNLLFPAMLFQLQLSSFPACHDWVVSIKLFTTSG